MISLPLSLTRLLPFSLPARSAGRHICARLHTHAHTHTQIHTHRILQEWQQACRRTKRLEASCRALLRGRRLLCIQQCLHAFCEYRERELKQRISLALSLLLARRRGTRWLEHCLHVLSAYAERERGKKRRLGYAQMRAVQQQGLAAIQKRLAAWWRYREKQRDKRRSRRHQFVTRVVSQQFAFWRHQTQISIWERGLLRWWKARRSCATRVLYSRSLVSRILVCATRVLYSLSFTNMHMHSLVVVFIGTRIQCPRLACRTCMGTYIALRVHVMFTHIRANTRWLSFSLTHTYAGMQARGKNVCIDCWTGDIGAA